MLTLDEIGTKQLKCLAIILVIISHFVQVGFLSLPYAFLCLGGWGVSIFLLASGYGLAKSYSKNKLTQFFNKRVLKILIPYTILTVFFLLIDYWFLHKTYSWKIIITSLLGINLDIYNGPDPSMWFIPYILFWYTIFFLIFSTPFSKHLKSMMLIGVTCALFWIPSNEFIFYLWNSYALAFPFGVILGKYEIRLTNKSILLTSLLFFLISIIFTEYSPSQTTLYRHFLNSITFSIGAFFLIVFIRLKKISLNIFVFIGAISYQLYLLEWVFIDKYKILYIVPQNKMISAIVYSVIILVLSIWYSNVIKKILSRWVKY